MEPRFAGIDIGTNTILMVIIAQHSDNTCNIVREEHNIARLGEGVDTSGNISEQALMRATTVLSDYRTVCQQENVQNLYAVTTSAVRDANNRKEIIASMEQALGVPINCISGGKEAQLSFHGTTSRLFNREANDTSSKQTTTVIDIGGGSTEIITGSINSGIPQGVSLQTGAVRLTERYSLTLPAKQDTIQSVKEEIQRHLAPLSKNDPGILMAVGGTSTTLTMLAQNMQEFQAAKVDNAILSLQAIDEQIAFLLAQDVETLRRHPCIHPKRADVLPAGALILWEILQFYEKRECIVSIRGLRYGAALLAAGLIE
jgi:exopolyphosphatase/guanosine-5'-triphosphate,3'-diphosphate pyrophosphatase